MSERETLVIELQALERHMRRAMLLRDSDPFGEFEVTLPQLRMLYQVEIAGVVSAQQLADRLRVTAPTVTNTIDRLVRRNLVSRVEDPEDRRRKRITLTQKGLDVLNGFSQHGLTYLMEAANKLTLDELRMMLHLFRRLAEIDAELQEERRLT